MSDKTITITMEEFNSLQQQIIDLKSMQFDLKENVKKAGPGKINI
jgi:hypothetical protein